MNRAAAIVILMLCGFALLGFGLGAHAASESSEQFVKTISYADQPVTFSAEQVLTGIEGITADYKRVNLIAFEGIRVSTAQAQNMYLRRDARVDAATWMRALDTVCNQLTNGRYPFFGHTVLLKVSQPRGYYLNEEPSAFIVKGCPAPGYVVRPYHYQNTHLEYLVCANQRQAMITAQTCEN